MFSQPVAPFEPVLDQLDDLAAHHPADWSEPALAAAVRGWCAAMSRLSAVGMALLDAWNTQMGWTADGARSGAAWLGAYGELESPARMLRVAHLLGTCAPVTAAALGAGDLSFAKAARLVGAISDGLEDAYTECEAVLVAAAKDLSLRQVTTLARRWKATATEVIEGPDPTDRLHRSRYVRIWETFDGQVAIEGLLDPDTGAAVRAVVEARAQQLFDADTTQAATLGDDTMVRTARQRYADALTELVTTGADHGIDDEHVGGPRAHLHLTLGIDTLLAAAAHRARHQHHHGGEPGADDIEWPRAVTDVLARHPDLADTLTATLAAGHGDGCLDGCEHPLDLAHISLLACDPHLSRVVLDDHGVPIDLGRSRRLANRTQRRALARRDKGCAFPGCALPPRWCDAHHIIDWILGGRTDMDNLVLLCTNHHKHLHTKHPWRCHIDPTTRRPVFTRPDGTPATPPGLPTRHRTPPPNPTNTTPPPPRTNTAPPTSAPPTSGPPTSGRPQPAGAAPNRGHPPNPPPPGPHPPAPEPTPLGCQGTTGSRPPRVRVCRGRGSGVEHETGGERGAELTTGTEIGRRRGAGHHHRRLGAAPLQTGGDLVERGQRPGGVVVAVHVGAERSSHSGVEAGVVDDVEEVLEGPREVAQVDGAAEQVRVSLEHVEGARGERRAHHHLHPVDRRVPRPVERGGEQRVQRG